MTATELFPCERGIVDSTLDTRRIFAHVLPFASLNIAAVHRKITMSYSSETAESGLDLYAITRGWKTLAVTTMGAMAASAALLFSITPLQEVSGRIIVEQRELSPAGITSVVRDREFLPTQAEILASPAVISGAVKLLRDETNAESIPQNDIAEIIGNLKVDPLTGTGVLLLQYTDVDADAAARTVDALVTSYSQYVTGIERQQNRELVSALTDRKSKIQQRLEQIQAEYEELRITSSESAPSDSVAISRIIASLESELAGAASLRVALERARTRLNRPFNDLQLSVLEFSPAAPVRDIALSTKNIVAILKELRAMYPDGAVPVPDPTLLEDRLRAAQDRVNELKLRFGPEHPEMRSAQAAANATEQELFEFAATAPGTIQESLDAVLLKEESIRQRYETQMAAAGQNNINMMNEAQKREELDQAREALVEVQTQLEHLQILDQAVEKGQAGTFVSVLEPPSPNPRSFVTNPVVVVGISGLIGFMAGILLLLSLPALRKLTQNSTQLVATGA